MATAITIPDQLMPKITKAAQKKGFDKPDDFVTRLIEEKLLELEEQEKIIEITDKVRTALEAKGISEEETLADFEKFRQRLYHERAEGNHNR
jgi:metal-responsive CopG/Arc/MetJ family transcriptional regulator